MTKQLKILKNISKPHWFEIIALIKQSQGLSVGELSEALKMSYMGIKKHCLVMHKLGYLETWRRPKEVGRPEKIYRLTDKLSPLFPGVGDEVCLDLLGAADVLETNGAEKLLLFYFRGLTETFSKEITGDSVQERAEKFAASRTKRGYFSQCLFEEEKGLWIDEYHNPLQSLFDKYPTSEGMETQMFERLLGGIVDRTVTQVAGLTRYRFDLSPR